MNQMSIIEHSDNISVEAARSVYLTIVDAARRVAISRSTVYRDISRGKLNATRTENGTLRIEESELRRAYGDDPAVAQAAEATPIIDERLSNLEEELRISNEQVQRLNAQLVESRAREAEYQGEIDRLGRQDDEARSEPHPVQSARHALRSRRHRINKFTDRILKSVAIGAFALAVTGILAVMIFTIDISGSSPDRTQSQQY